MKFSGLIHGYVQENKKKYAAVVNKKSLINKVLLYLTDMKGEDTAKKLPQK